MTIHETFPLTLVKTLWSPPETLCKPTVIPTGTVLITCDTLCTEERIGATYMRGKMCLYKNYIHVFIIILIPYTLSKVYVFSQFLY